MFVHAERPGVRATWLAGTLLLACLVAVLLLLSLLVATLSLGTGRTTALQRMVLLVIFAVYLFTTIVP